MVLADLRTDKPRSNNPALVGNYNSVMVYASDYTPFGRAMAGRGYKTPTNYRYGFNGKEYHNDVQAAGNLLDYGNRLYDPMVGRFWSVDPLTRNYPYFTPYQFASNSPIQNIDMDGKEGLFSMVDFNNAMRTSCLHLYGAEQGEKEYQLLRKGQVYGAIGAIAITTDVFVTKGWMSRTLGIAQLADAFEHNRANTPEGRTAQNERSKQALTNFAIGGANALAVGKSIQAFSYVAKFLPKVIGEMSDAHWVKTINAKTRFGAGDIKTIALGNTNIAKDLDEIWGGKASFANNIITTSSGRTFGYHPETGNVYLTGGPGTIQLTRAEFNVYSDMLKSGGLKGDALKAFEGMKKAGNQGLSAGSEAKLTELYNSGNFQK